MMKLKTLEDVKERVAAIKEEADDPEGAHASEDGLHQDVLKFIAKGKCSDPAALAQEALKTLKLRFPRWCA